MIKSYLIALTFVSGEYEQTFHKIFKAKTIRSLDRQVGKYLAGYYPDAKKERDDLYFYYGGEIAIKIEGCQEITNPEQVLEVLAV